MTSEKIRIILTCGVIIYFVLILYWLKTKALNLKYSLLWILSGIAMGILVIFPDTLIHLSRLMGIMTPMYALLVCAIALIIAILMSITSIVSRQNRKIRTLIQENALLEKRVRELENNSKQI
ncbi:MAG: DUF2304 domain-containing protein [Lachnospiraceae bacterium]|nr:DUF2304 domain-containing protein [Lachnospiraceae bacterium]